jgi:Uma2 family endonuclease
MAIPKPTRRPATYDDLRRVPPHRVAEIVDGDLYTSPRPALRHAQAEIAVATELKGPFDRGRGGPGGWIILVEPELHLVGQVMVPDVAGWRRERLPEIPDVPAIDLAPDWVCEVLSPSTESIDRSLKMPRYAESGVAHAWLVDPVARTLEVYRLERGGYHLAARFEGDGPVRPPPFEALDFDLSALWAR